MANFSENFKQKEPSSICPLCGQHLDDQDLAFKCPVVLQSIDITDKFEDIYLEKPSKHLADTLQKIIELRSKYQLPP